MIFSAVVLKPTLGSLMSHLLEQKARGPECWELTHPVTWSQVEFRVLCWGPMWSVQVLASTSPPTISITPEEICV